MENEKLEVKPKVQSNWELVRFALIAIIIVIPIRLFIAQPFIVSGSSMDPTFENGQYLIVDQLSYRLESPKRGSVLIFRYPENPSKFFIKRIIGLPGETLELSNGKVTIKNKEHPEGFMLNEPYVVYERSFTMQTILGSSQYFVMGDNRIGSLDSRFWGPLDKKFIIGRPLIRLLPINHVGILPGDFSTP